MIIKPMIRGNVCMNAHPHGSYKNVQEQIAYVQKVCADNGKLNGPKNALIIGASTGYGLASRIVASFGAGAHTIGVSFEREPSEKRTGSSGYYNTIAFENEAKKAGLTALSLNVDAFSHEAKAETVDLIKARLGTVDLVVYSLASPVRKNPDGEEVYRSVLKPIGQTYTAKSINPQTGEIAELSIEPASDEEIDHTIKVMGGDDWVLWIQSLSKANVLSQSAQTIAYSYIGPDVTRAVYREGTIGKAKEHLESSVSEVARLLKSVGGRAFVSVNKALVTRASAVIPVVPLYLALLYKIMKARGTQEGCIEQMYRLYCNRVYGTQNINPDLMLDEAGRIRLDDWELDSEVQNEIRQLWPQVTSDNIAKLGDLDSYNSEFLRIHGFGRADIDYNADTSTELIL